MKMIGTFTVFKAVNETSLLKFVNYGCLERMLSVEYFLGLGITTKASMRYYQTDQSILS